MISVILPSYNEAESIGNTVRALRGLAIPDLEIIVCDDHSPDHTLDAVRAADPLAVPLTHEGPRGLSASVVYGFEHAEGDLLVCMDADGQHRPEDLPAVAGAAEQCGFAVGSRFVAGGGFQEKWSPFRLFVSRTSALLAKMFLGTRLHDPMSGFFAVKRAVFEAARPHLSPAGFKIMLELLFLLTRRGGFRVGEYGITFGKRIHGKSKLSMRVIWEYLGMLIRLRRQLKGKRS